jgi:hypothetical protein
VAQAYSLADYPIAAIPSAAQKHFKDRLCWHLSAIKPWQERPRYGELSSLIAPTSDQRHDAADGEQRGGGGLWEGSHTFLEAMNVGWPQLFANSK